MPPKIHVLLLPSPRNFETLTPPPHPPPLQQLIRALDILPLSGSGDPSQIRQAAARFAALPQPVAINVPNLLLWAVTCCARQRERLLRSPYTVLSADAAAAGAQPAVANEGARRQILAHLRQMTLDLAAYTSQLKYKFPPHLLEALARAAAE